MQIDCLSDLHGNFPQLEGGDLLIIAGDLYEPGQSFGFMRWLINQKYRKIVYIAGNHDTGITRLEPSELHDDRIEYLCDSGTKFCYYPPVEKDCENGTVIARQDLKIWGSPWSLWFDGINPKCTAFTVKTEEELSEKWALIPDDIDILITHSPPFTIRDKTTCGKQVGSVGLMAHHLSRFRPKLWVFGHVHEAYGQDGPYHWSGTRYVNASHVNERYQPVNKPVRIMI